MGGAYYYRTGKNNKRIPREIDMVCVIIKQFIKNNPIKRITLIEFI